MTDTQKKLIDLLRNMFQFDQADLDFGIYRIMNKKRTEINTFLEEDLPAQINEQLQSVSGLVDNSELDSIYKQIADLKSSPLSESIKAAGIADLEEKRRQLEKSAVDVPSIENDIYNHLTNFFSRYYDEGDFISQRRYKDGVYAIPYEGEEVKLHWANADQYYVKTSEYFKDYTFKLSTGKKVHFSLLDVETEQDNNKAKNKRTFQLADIPSPFEIKNDDLYIYMLYKAGEEKQNVYNTRLVEKFQALPVAEFCAFTELNDSVTAGDKKQTVLLKQLAKYTARNSFDYFIHKDLGKFLNRELDFYIKNEVVFLDDIDTQDDAKLKVYLTKARIIRAIAKKIILFLAQLENFQKKLFLKKKFVVETQYCITLDRIPQSFYTEIASNDKQRKEWVRLFAIDEMQPAEGELQTQTPYSEPLTIDFLKENQNLVLDTKFFSEDFKERLIDSIENLDESLDGLLIHSENFQALNLIGTTIGGKVSNIFIDPPYNTGDDDFIYKDNYQSSSWLSMIHDRIASGIRLLSNDGVFYASIGDEEQEYLSALLRQCYGKERFFATLVWEKKKKGTFLNGKIARMKDYILCVSKTSDFRGLIGEINSDEETYPCVNASNPREIRKIPAGLKSKYKELNVKKEKGAVITAGNMTLVLHSDLIIENGILTEELLIEGNWRYSQQSMDEYAKNGELYITQDLYLRRIVKESRYKRMKDLLLRLGENGESDYRSYDKNNLNKYGWGSNEDANDELQQLLGEQYVVSYPKPSKLNALLFTASRHTTGYWLDYFAGSGTSAHAVINLNRDDGGNRKYILCEMGDYFDSVVKVRTEKVMYSKDWKDGKPVSRTTGISHAFKYIRLESYEDTLNNLAFSKKPPELLDGVREHYLLSYMLDFETKKSDSLLNVDKLSNPFDYALHITQNQECTEQKIDLVETFNYLIGLQITKNNALKNYASHIEDISLPAEKVYKIKLVEGTNRSGDNVLVVWRNLLGNAALDNRLLIKQVKGYMQKTGVAYKTIYVNGDNTLANERTETETWNVVLIEEEMKKRMFEEK